METILEKDTTRPCFRNHITNGICDVRVLEFHRMCDDSINMKKKNNGFNDLLAMHRITIPFCFIVQSI